ncbi:uncharacterized protein M421DRAFT_4866 [Didymella exigua CBS 183.55]|uniref:Uncharacterized protein n=1 Tax=Didymella exigua CBS 183.55 TaxID=1150837 RepID=A0A6A5RKU6_9PLEO|nr:uncharacterized protein M421DRAFT_4866 [Didymella exigua CBS 183.55]KAF1929051.1 hypothetical protein M421DRAFT_4866 [Didymella exigua CBS 183.55]
MPGQWTARLGPCSRQGPGSRQAKARPTARRRPSPAAHVTPLTGDDLGPTQRDAHRTLRTRRDGKAALPLPPLLDPVVLAKRAQHEAKKAKPDAAALTPFQRRLSECPFAHALASPVRECRYTATLQPSALLTALHMRPHPTTAAPWLLPVSLTTRDSQLGLPLRFHTRAPIATQLGTKKAWERALYPRLFEQLGPGGAAKLVWREDMPALLLGLLRTRLHSALAWSFAFRGRLRAVASPHGGALEALDDVSCVLCFGSLRAGSRGDVAQDRCDAITAELDKWALYFAQSFGPHLDPHAQAGVTHRPPSWYSAPLVPRLQPRIQFPELEYRTAEWRGRRVPVYSLVDLLGEDRAHELINGAKSQYASHQCVVMKRARHNVPVELLLMQLQTYVARPGP